MTHPSSTSPNREAWLLKATAKLTPLFKRADYVVPEVRVSIGWPSRSALGAKSRRIGECWSDTTASDSVHHIFLSPLLVVDPKPTRILDVLLHEVVHAVVGCHHKHGKEFAKCAKAMGLTGKMTATVASPELDETLKNILDVIGPFPGGGLDPATATRQKQTTRMRKYECPSCGQIVRAAADGLSIVCGDCNEPYVQEVK